jgi:predicted dehydrogenase
LIEQKAIGEICSVTIGIGYRKDLDSLGQPEDGLGVMHRFGCYPLSLAFYMWDKPQSQKFEIIKTNTGVDINCAVILGYPNHTVSIIAGINGTQSNEVYIVGTKGSIRIPAPFFDATSIQVRGTQTSQKKGLKQRLGKKLARIIQPFDKLLSRSSTSPFEGSGLRGEAAEVMRCLNQGLLESSLMPLDESISIHQLLDKIRHAED